MFFFRGFNPDPATGAASGLLNVLLLQAWVPSHAFTLGYNAVSWSLSAEMFFYLLFPVLIYARASALVIVLHVVVVALLPTSAVDVIQASAAANFNPLLRCSEFAVGILAFHAWRAIPPFRSSSALEVVALLIAVTGVAFIPGHVPRLCVLFCLGVAFAPAIIIFASGRGLVSELLNSAPMQLLGGASFAFYLSHHMVFRLCQKFLGGAMSGIPLFVAALIVAIITSIALHLAFEVPVQRWLVALYRRRRRLAAGLAQRETAPLPI